MKKKMLEKIPKLEATEEMMKMAEKDVPKKSKSAYYHHVKYEYGLYMRCQVVDGILNIAFFQGSNMRTGSRKPTYSLYIMEADEEFITWDTVHEKWTNAMLCNIRWPSYIYDSGKYISPRDSKLVKEYLKTDTGDFLGISLYQQAIREMQLEKKHKRETDPWDEQMALIPDLPKDWNIWVHRHGMRKHFIFYTYRKGGATKGYCTWCQKEVPIKMPKNNMMGKCRCCGHEIQFKARGKAGSFYTENEVAYLIQGYKDGFVVRQFRVRAFYVKDKYETTKAYPFEERRVLYSNWVPTVYEYGNYKQRGSRWNKIEQMRCFYPVPGEVYKRNLPSQMKGELGKTGLPEIIAKNDMVDPEFYLNKFIEMPYLEQLIKANLDQLVEELLFSRSRNAKIYFNSAKSLSHSLGIDKNRMARLRARNGGVAYLNWLRYEKSMDTVIDENVIDSFIEWNIHPQDLEFILDRMGALKIRNYLCKQNILTDRSPKQLVSTWEDYLSMANRLKMVTQMEIFYKPKNLIDSHDKVVCLIKEKGLLIKAAEVLSRYPDVDDICSKIKDKYEFKDKKYMIIIPERIEDILMEGTALNHCTDRDDRYFARIQHRETYVAFLRKTKKPDNPYYTVEFEPDGTVRQKRTVGDTQNADIKDAEDFLKNWQRAIRSRLTKEDFELARRSALLRAEEFKELRKRKVKIWNGKLQGKLLADVLEADLMEVALCESRVG